MKRKDKLIIRFSALIVTLVMIAVVTTTSFFAAYLKYSEEIKNIFKPADSVTPEISEKFDNNIKEDVCFEVGDTDYPVYVRAAIVITWQDNDGIVYFSKPIKDADYTIELNMKDWQLGEDGFYYFINPVVSGGLTSSLIYECKQIKAAPVDGYTLSVEILVQTVQAVGYTDGENSTPETDAWKDAWGIS